MQTDCLGKLDIHDALVTIHYICACMPRLMPHLLTTPILCLHTYTSNHSSPLYIHLLPSYTHFLHCSETCGGQWYLPSIILARISPAPPYAKGEWPVISMKRMTPKLHTSRQKISLTPYHTKIASYPQVGSKLATTQPESSDSTPLQ